MSELVVELLEVRERLDAELIRLVGAWDRDQAWAIDGSLSAKAWLTHRAPIAGRDAHRLVKTARIADGHEAISHALAQGAITAPHVEAIGRVVSSARHTLLSDHEELLVEQAATLTIDDFTTVMRRWAVLADDQLAEDDFTAKHERRHIHASRTLDGWVAVDGFLDPVGGESFINLLDHLARPDPADAPDGPRSLSQRRADALVDLVRWYHSGATPGGSPPQVNVIVDVATLHGEVPENPATARCELQDAGPIARSVLDQLCCDAEFTRFIMSGPSVVLDMGRAARYPTRQQRRAVMVRDRHCQFPSCRRTARWCDVHHIAGWVADLGRTDIDNLILLCRRHHTLVHNSRWRIARTPSGEFEFTHPARGP